MGLTFPGCSTLHAFGLQVKHDASRLIVPLPRNGCLPMRSKRGLHGAQHSWLLDAPGLQVKHEAATLVVPWRHSAEHHKHDNGHTSAAAATTITTIAISVCFLAGFIIMYGRMECASAVASLSFAGTRASIMWRIPSSMTTEI